jgi:hypothetical protein
MLSQTRARMDIERADCIASCQDVSKGGSIIVLKVCGDTMRRSRIRQGGF